VVEHYLAKVGVASSSLVSRSSLPEGLSSTSRENIRHNLLGIPLTGLPPGAFADALA
jgi:hypothetical protein